jgi:hypothetical protein
MAIKLEIFGDTIEAFTNELDVLAKLIRPFVEAGSGLPGVTVVTPSALDGLSLEVLRETIVNRFEQEGYEVTIKVREEPVTAAEAEAMVKPAEPEPAPQKRRGRPRLDPETAKARLNAGNGAARPKLAIVEPEEEDPFDSSPAQPDDKTFVVDRLKELYDSDSDQRPRITAFMTRMAKAYGGDKMPNLPADKFPEIRKQMEAEFDA